MQTLFRQYGFDRPIEARVQELLARLRQVDNWREALLKKWAQRLTTARLRKAGSGTGARTELESVRWEGSARAKETGTFARVCVASPVP